MAVGLPLKTTYANGDVYSASDVNDTNGTINAYVSTGKAAGVNKIINGDFGVWQRGTSFTTSVYCSDRWVANFGSVTSPSYSRSTFTAGTAPVTGYEGTYYISMSGTLSDAVNGYYQLDQRIEDVRTFAGQTVTLSFWAKGSATGTISANISQYFGIGGSSNVTVNATNINITTSWVRYSTTLSFPSISGKTIGTGSYARMTISKLQGTATGNQAIWGAATFTGTLDVWGVQLEAGSTATAFQTATGTIQGELAACQRYYFRQVANAAGNAYFGNGHARNTTTDDVGLLQAPVEMRVVPTSVDYSTLKLSDGATGIAITALTIGAECNTISFKLNVTVASGLTAYRPYDIAANSSTAAYLGFSAEL